MMPKISKRFHYWDEVELPGGGRGVVLWHDDGILRVAVYGGPIKNFPEEEVRKVDPWDRR